MNNCKRCLKDIDYCEECSYNKDMYDDGYSSKHVVRLPWPGYEEDDYFDEYED